MYWCNPLPLVRRNFSSPSRRRLLLFYFLKAIIFSWAGVEKFRGKFFNYPFAWSHSSLLCASWQVTLRCKQSERERESRKLRAFIAYTSAPTCALLRKLDRTGSGNIVTPTWMWECKRLEATCRKQTLWDCFFCCLFTLWNSRTRVAP